MKENYRFTLNEIERAGEIYCKDCCRSCDECGLYDFIHFELFYCLRKAVENE